MSLHYRTPLEEFALRLEPSEQVQIRENATRAYMNREMGMLSDHFNFFLKTPQKKWLTERGVELSVFPNVTHSHPACKTLENHLLYRVVPGLLRGQEDLAFLTIKEQKLEKVRKLFKGDEVKVAINRLVTTRDYTRYGSRPSPERLDMPKGGNLFIHDELHYWTMGQVVDFLNIYEPVRMVATFVYPVELIFKYRTSLNPKIYTFEVEGENLIFSPDGVVTESYVQPISAGELLSRHSIKTDKHMYDVELEYTIGAHHVLVFNRNGGDKVLHQKNRFFGPYSCVDASDIFEDSGRVAIAGIEVETLQKIIMYLFSLKKPDPHSAVAKLRQMMAEDVDLDSMWVVRDLANRISKFSSSWCNNSMFTVMRDWMVDMLPKKIGNHRVRLVDDFDRNLMKLRPLCFNLVTDNDNTDWLMVAKKYIEAWLEPHGHRGRPYGSEALIWYGLEDTKKKIPRSEKVTRVYEHSLYNWFHWYHSGSYRFTKGVELLGPGPMDSYDGRIVPYGDFQERMLRLAIKTIEEYEDRRKEKGRRMEVFKALREYHKAREEGSLAQLPQPEHTSCGKDSSNITEEEAEKAINPNMDKPKDQDISPCKDEKVEPEEEADSWDDDERAVPANLKPNFDPTKCLTRVAAGNQVELYKTKMRPKFSTGDWMKVGRRKVRFYSTDENLAYFHDRVAYRTHEPEAELKELMEMVSETMGVKYNTALVQEYWDGGIPKHRDDEDCYDGDPIVTLNLNGVATFNTWVEGKKESYNLLDGDVLVMLKDSRKVRHEVSNTSRGRISITLRKQPRQISFGKAFRASAGTRCLLDSFADGMNEDRETFCKAFENKMYKSICLDGLSDLDAQDICKTMGICISLVDDDTSAKIGDGDAKFAIRHKDHHFSLLKENGKGTSNTKIGDADEREADKDLGRLLNKLIGSSDGFTTETTYQADPGRAKRLAESLFSGNTGVCCGYLKEGFRIIPGCNSASNARAALEKLGNKVDLPVTTITGFAGSGKSHRIQDILRKHPVLRKGTLLISPRVRLAEDWKEKVKGVSACTFESALKRDRRVYHTVVMDEITLYPPGYLDLLLYTDLKAGSMDKRYVVLGDPLQAAYYNETDSLKLGAETFYSHLEVDQLEYGFRTHRLNEKVARALSVHTFSKVAGDRSLKICPDLPSAKNLLGSQPEVVLVPSRLCKNRFTGMNCITYGESQGLTFKKGCIYLNEDSRVCSDQHLMVALTRFTEEVCFIYDAKGPLQIYKSNCRGLLGRILSAQNITTAFYEGMAAPKLKFNHIRTGGGKNSRGRRNRRAELERLEIAGDQMDREARLEGDPWQKTQIFLGQRVNMEEPECPEPEIAKESNKVHVPLNIDRPSRLDMDRGRDKDSREIHSKIGFSNQFREERRDIDPNVEELPQPCTAESTYMHHYNSDDVTFWAAVKKRLKFANPEKNYRKLQKKDALGRYMAREFLSRVKLSSQRDQGLLDECRAEFEKVKLKKSAAILANNSKRSDPDGKTDEVKLFLKTQLCTKFEKRFCEGKAGQTIACFHHNVLNHFSPYCRYIEKRVTQALPDYVYIHQKKNFGVLDEFVKERFRGGICVESDYEAYDASQDATVLAFELALLEHMQMDKEFIEDYKLMKCTLGSELGALAIMRFTGEFSTFLFNTMANIAFTHLRYIWRKEVILFAGDDMCAFGDLPIDNNNNEFFKKLTLKAKVNRVTNPMFCGWCLTRFGLFKEPRLILDRINVCREKDVLAECMNSYFEEYIFAYAQGYHIELMMDCEQLDAHQTCTRKFLRYQHLLSEKNRGRLRELTPCATEYISD